MSTIRNSEVNCLVCLSLFKKRERKNIYCSKLCQNESLRIHSYELFIKGELKSSAACKKHIIEKEGNKCSKCSLTDWQELPIMLEVDHVDGNPDNHLPTNLRLLCPNCHSQTPTFRKKNKDGPKSDRRSKLRRALYVKPF